MTDDSIALRELLEKSADADLLREMIGFAAERFEVQGLRAPVMASARWRGWCSATAIAVGSGRPAPGRSSCASRSSGRAATPRIPGAASGQFTVGSASLPCQARGEPQPAAR
jgi:hypothetical protein